MSEIKKPDHVRRHMLKGTIMAGGAIAATPWQKPIVKTTILPAHAETTLIMTETTLIMAKGFDSQAGVSIQVNFPGTPPDPL